jgi:hypothetical protein
MVDPIDRTICTVTAAGEIEAWLGTPEAPGHRDGIGPAAGFLKPAYVAARAGADWGLVVSDNRGHTIRMVDASGQVRTLAGHPGRESYRDGRGEAAFFAWPTGVALDREGNVLVCDAGNYVIRKVAPDGEVTTLAGFPYEYGFRDGHGAEARFHRLRGLALDPASGWLYVADGHAIRQISPDGEVRTVLGNVKEPGFEEWAGQPRLAGPIPLAGVRCLNEPWGLAFHDGLLFIADKQNHAIRIYHPETGELRTLAGDPTQTKLRFGPLRNGAPRHRPKQYAALAFPTSLAFSGDGLCLVSTGSGLVRIAFGSSQALAAPAPGLALAPCAPSAAKE